MRDWIAPCLALGLLAAAPRAQFTSFDDFVWTFEGPPGSSGSVTTDLMHVESPAGGFCLGEPVSAFTSIAPWAGTVRVHLDWTIIDICHFDWPVYVINGVATQVWVEGGFSGCWFNGPRELEFEVSAGDTFGLGVGTADCWKGPGIADWTQFEFLPKTWIDAGGELDPRLDFEVSPPGLIWDYAEALAGPGDVNGDGELDIAVRSREPQPSAGPKGIVSMLSGTDGAVLWSLAGSASFGESLAAPGDVNGDGVPDLAASVHDDELVLMLSGSDGSTLWSATGPAGFGRAPAPFGDITGDGITEIAVSAYPAPDTPLFVLSGADGSQVASYLPPPGSGGYGSMAAAGDVNGDGTGDLFSVLAVPYGQLWKAAIVSGLDGTVLAFLDPPFISLGVWSLSTAGDVDGDGTPDLAVGASWEFAPPGLYNPGTVTIFSGATSVPLSVIYGTQNDGNFGYAIEGGLDIDEDGTPEIAVGSPLYHTPYEYDVTGRAVIMRASDGTVVQEFIGKDLESFGQALQLLPGEHDTALAIAAPHGLTGLGNGRLAVYGDLDHAVGLPSLSVHGVPVAGMPWLASIEHGLPSQIVLLVIGASQADLPFKGGVLVPSVDLVLVERIHQTGTLNFAGHWPPGVDPTADWWVQAWLVDPAGPQGWSATEARRSPPP